MRELAFRDRKDAGIRLAAALEEYRSKHPIVLGLPRGGVVVAAEVARALDAPLDVVVARKIGAPMQPELAIGAVAPAGIVVEEGRFGFDEEALREGVAEQQREMRRRIARFRADEDELPDVKGRTVIIVDDGLATGLTAYAAVLAVRTGEPDAIVVAVPVAPAGTLQRLREVADDVVCLSTPNFFIAIGEFYANFDQVTDDEVESLLRSVRHASTEIRTQSEPSRAQAGPHDF